MPDIYRQIEELIDYIDYEDVPERTTVLENKSHDINTIELPF
jgi:hypothetical protein